MHPLSNLSFFLFEIGKCCPCDNSFFLELYSGVFTRIFTLGSVITREINHIGVISFAMGTERCGYGGDSTSGDSKGDLKGDWQCEQRQCRICAAVISQNNAVHIFAEDGRRYYLQTKIRKYLYIMVSSEDKLPKTVCSGCIKRLEGVHNFATMAYKAQERLKVQACETPDNTHLPKEVCMLTEKETNDRSSLHLILSKAQDSVQGLTDCESFDLRASEEEVKEPLSNTEEMEVKVDPMLFLQCDQSTSETSDLSENDNEDEEGEGDGEEEEEEDEEDEDRDEQHFPESPPLISKFENGNYRDKKGLKGSKDSGDSMDNHELWSEVLGKKGFNGKSSKILHANADNLIGNFVCPICNKRISTKGNLKVHLETHRPKGKYGCDICGRIFKTQSNLFRHKEYHGGVQYPCNVCGRVYPTNSTLRAHSITHSDLRPHACPLCDKTFKRNQDLKFHINQHTGARPYQCPYCPKAFASSGNCFSHRKRMHPREVHRDRQIAADLMR